MFWCVKQKDYLCIRKTESNNSIIINRKLFASERVQGSNPCRRTNNNFK